MVERKWVHHPFCLIHAVTIGTMLNLNALSVADLGFPRGGGANSPGGGANMILPNFPKNCMKLKEFGPPGGGGGASKILLCRSATGCNNGLKNGLKKRYV